MTTEQTTIVTIRKSNQVRGITFLPHGQQWAGKLPAGDYELLGECNLNYSDLGLPRCDTAVKLRQIIGGSHWYIAPEMAKSLPINLTHDMCPIGSQWRTDAGNEWEVIAKDGDRVTISRLDSRGRTTADTYVWNLASLTETTARRVK